MARHRTVQEKRELQERARQLRAQGRSRREIQAELGIGDDLAKAFLRGVPLPDSLVRPRAEDDLRERVREMRWQGATCRTPRATPSVRPRLRSDGWRLCGRACGGIATPETRGAG